jgi:hypothetical protein
MEGPGENQPTQADMRDPEIGGKGLKGGRSASSPTW